MKLHSIDYVVDALRKLLAKPPQFGVWFLHVRGCLTYADLRLSYSGWERGSVLIYHRLTKDEVLRIYDVTPHALAVKLLYHFEKMLDK